MRKEETQLARIEKKMDRILHLLESEGLSISFEVDSDNAQIHDSNYETKGTFNKRIENLSVGAISTDSIFFKEAFINPKSVIGGKISS